MQPSRSRNASDFTVYPTTLTFVKSIFERRPPGSPYDALAPASPARAA
jgi:hypothetical protein